VNSIEFFFDPACPFAWLTSRWVTEVAEQSDLQVRWRFIALKILNEGKDVPEQYARGHAASFEMLRVVAAVSDDLGNDAVAALYTALGTALHTDGGSAELFGGDDVDPGPVIDAALVAAGLPESYRKATIDDARDSLIRSETELALSRTGPDVGTPILTFDLEHPETSTFFGPVINRIPRGAEALQLWDALATLARLPGVSELKRSLRGELDFS